uniref:IL17RA/B N-terminal domain-containing protein n=1 Tax=Spermophilus dauricus TaxID=99837 RepID=A0A8C9QN71_SPEDA
MILCPISNPCFYSKPIFSNCPLDSELCGYPRSERVGPQGASQAGRSQALNHSGTSSLGLLGIGRMPSLIVTSPWLPGTCLDDSWIHPRNLTPNYPKHVQIQLRLARTQHGDLIPVVHIEWTLQTDAGLFSPKGAKLSVLQLNTNERLCVEFEFRSKLKRYKQVRRQLLSGLRSSEVPVQICPQIWMRQGLIVSLSGSADCEDSRMKIATPCVSSGSLWDPNITVETLEAHQLRVSFMLWNESSHYQILLNSFPHMEDHSCFKHIQRIPAPKQEEFHQRANLTLPLHSSNWCCHHRVQVGGRDAHRCGRVYTGGPSCQGAR